MGEAEQVKGELNLWSKLVPELVGAQVVDSCKGSHKMFFESSDSSFGGIDTMVARRDQLDCHFAGADVLLNCFGAFVVNDVECWIAKTLVNAAMKEGSVREAIGRTMMVLRS